MFATTHKSTYYSILRERQTFFFNQYSHLDHNHTMDKPPDSQAPTAEQGTASLSETPAKRQRMDDEASSIPSASVEEIDPAGDLVVAVGPKPSRYMRISAKHLTMISSTFRALLGSGFAESQTAHDTIETAVKLPEDDPDGMRTMFRLAHHQVQDPRDVDVGALTQVLVACDKYDCFKVFRFILREAWLRWLLYHGLAKSKPATQLSDTPVHTHTLVEAVCMACLFGDGKRFKEAMKLLFDYATKEDMDTASDLALLAMMPKGFEDGLKETWTDAVLGPQTWVHDVLKQWIGRVARVDQICVKTERRLGLVIHAIERHKLAEASDEPAPVARLVDTERDLTKVLEDLARRDETIRSTGTRACKCVRCGEGWKFGAFVMKPWREYIANRGCACYECFKEGKYDAAPEVRGCQHE
jgi:hypothetical protein